MILGMLEVFGHVNYGEDSSQAQGCGGTVLATEILGDL